MDSDKRYILNYHIKTSDTTIVINLENMLINADIQDFIVYTDSIYKIIINGFPIHFTGSIDKQQRFYPLAYMLYRNEDKIFYKFTFYAIKNAF